MLGMALLGEKSVTFLIKELPKWICIGLFNSIITTIIDVMFFIQIFKIKTNIKNKIVLIASLSICTFISFMIIPEPYSRIIDLIATFCIIKFALNQSNAKSALGETLNAVIIVSIEIVMARLLCHIFNIKYIDGLYNIKYRLSLVLSVLIARGFLILFLKKFKIHIYLSDHLKTQNIKSIFAISVLGMLIVIVSELELLCITSKFPYLSFILNVVLYLYSSIQGIRKINMIEKQELKIHSLEVYNKTLSLMYDSIRGFKHDFSNIVLALDGYAKTENIKGIKKMSKAMLRECATVNKMAILDPKIIENSAIYSIVTNKYYLAKEQNLNMNIEVLYKIDENRENNYEICRILGILLDNAIEAAKDTKEKIVNVKFLNDAKVNRKLIIVENSYKNKNVDIDKIFEKGYSSKESADEEHGLGLWNIRNILMSHEDLNLYTTADDLFRQQLEIY